MDALSYFLCSVYAVFSKNVLVLLTLYREAYAGVIGLVLIELVVLTGQYCIQDNTGQRTYCQSGQADGDLADVECDSACRSMLLPSERRRTVQRSLLQYG